MDSLMSVEMRRVLERDFGIVKSVKELKATTPRELEKFLVQQNEEQQ